MIDVETGGLDPQTCSVLSLAAVVVENGEIRDTFHRYVAEGDIRITEESYQIHGLTEDFLKGSGEEPIHVVTDLDTFLIKNGMNMDKITLVGASVAFDISFLRRLFRLAGCAYDSRFSRHSVDLSSVGIMLDQGGYFDILGGLGTPTLNNMAALFGNKRLTLMHDALEDALLAAHVYKDMLGIHSDY